MLASLVLPSDLESSPVMNHVTLVCLPFAGAGASVFSPWRRRRKDLDVRGLQLPGRENLIEDELCTDVASATDALLRELSGMVGGGDLVLFGHSLGAILAFELARRIEAEGYYGLRRLLVSGSADPWSVRVDRATGLSDDEFIGQVQALAGYEHPALGDPELRELILPTLRADVEMHEAYRAEPDARINAPITAILGDADTLVSAPQASRWQDATDAEFELATTSGGHMYLTEDPVAAFEVVGRLIDDARGRQRRTGR